MTAVHDALGTWVNYSAGLVVATLAASAASGCYDILELLSLRKGMTVTKGMFLNHLYGGKNEPHLKIIDVFICKLRKKLLVASGGKNYIETVWGRGYVMRQPGNEQTGSVAA